jgi:hypothetical protein
MSLRKYIRKNIYRWHRVTSLVIALPILMWTASGFLHPVMSSFKPQVRNQYLPSAAIDTAKIKISLQDALAINHVDHLHNFRIIKLDGVFYYQVQQLDKDTLSYFSCIDGSILGNGDKLYAGYLAQRYLSEPNSKPKETASHQHGAAADLGSVAVFTSPKKFEKSKITAIELIKEFTAEYKSSNVLLPVYRVQFDRADHIRLFIETSTDRMATAIDQRKAWFNRFFAAAHSWSFLDGIGSVKYVLLGTISGLCFLSSLFGFYVYNLTNKKKKTAQAKTNRTWHRRLGNVFVVTTLLFAFSGAWHTFHKLSENPEKKVLADRSEFLVKELKLPLTSLAAKLGPHEKMVNVSVVKLDNKNYWQVSVSKGKEKQKKYFDTENLSELNDGDRKYACQIACVFAKKTEHSIKHTACLTDFTHSYSMMNKRLPVMEIAFDNEVNYYVETATGQLAAIINPSDKAERFSFSNLHMHHYWEMWLGKDNGKTAKNIVLISSTLGLLLLALTGIMMYSRKKLKKGKLQANVSA